MNFTKLTTTVTYGQKGEVEYSNISIRPRMQRGETQFVQRDAQN